MSLNHDESGKRWVQAQVEVPGTPEEVWEAIATGPGVSSWFVPTEVRADGAIVCRFGPGMESVSTRTAWEPPRRFAGEGQMGPGGPTLATEWTVEAQAGGTCIVRVVHSLFASGDDWDHQLEAIERGWPAYFEILRLYLTHFMGETGTLLPLMGMSLEPAPKAWERLTTALGLTALVPGSKFQAPSGCPALSGWVEKGNDPGHPLQYLTRLETPARGLCHLFAMPMGERVLLSMRMYLYGGEGANALQRDSAAWTGWMQQNFPFAKP